jgi:alpha-tubulin suppressor-like RCC1 family protein
MHALALAEDGQIYAWGTNRECALLGNSHIERELLPKLVEALRGVRVGSVAVGGLRSYAVTCTGELWAWGIDAVNFPPIGHGKKENCVVPKPMSPLRGVKVDAVSTAHDCTLALADNGRMYAWGGFTAAKSGALGLGSSGRGAWAGVVMPERMSGPRVACGL